MDVPLLPAAPLQRRNASSHSIRRGALPQVPKQNAGRIALAFEVTFVGSKRVVTVFHGKLRYATGREVLAARLLADHGECVLHGRNGKCISVLRDPLIRERPPVTGRRVQWSRNPADAIEGERRMLASVSSVQRRVRHARHAGAQNPMYSPAQCPNDCRGLRDGMAWALAKGAKPPTDGEHHPVCKFAAAWAATLVPIETTDVLYDLELSTVERAALPSEIEEAAENERKIGMRNVTVAGRLFAVMSAAEAERAALEARGEEPDAIDTAIGTGAVIDLDGEPEGDELVMTSTANSGPSTESDRDQWPTIDPLTSSDVSRQRADVTARDYLARPSPEVNGA